MKQSENSAALYRDARKLTRDRTFAMPGFLEKGTLHFALLGPPQVYHSGQLLTFPSRKALALLLYLAVEEGKHSRKTLSELFWPESDAAHARSALRTTVLELRDVLMKDALPAQRTGLDRIPHLHIDRDTLSVDMTSGVSLDLHTLQAAWILAHDTAHVAATLPEETRRVHLAQLQEATRLSRGEFLDGFSLHNARGFDDWARFQREYWHLRMQLVFDRLSSQYEEAGEFEQAIAVIIRWLALTFLNEEASQRLMRLHFATGNRVAALKAYEVFRAHLALEIHIEPAPETMALAERIRSAVPVARLAHHALAAGMLEAAFRLSMAAGDEARTVSALHVAIEHYEQAWQLLATNSSMLAKIAASDLHHLCVALKQTYELTSIREQGRPLYKAILNYLLQMATQNNETVGVVKTQWYKAMLDLSTADLEEAIIHGEYALTLARSSGLPDLIVQSLDALISVKLHKGVWEEYEQLVNALYVLTSGLLDSGAYTDALKLARQAAASARTLNTGSSRATTLLLRALIQLGGVYRAMQAGDVAREIDLEALMLHETTDSSSYTAVVTSALCADYVLVGEWADALRYAQQAATVADEYGQFYAEIPHRCVTEALLRGGDAVKAQEHLGRLNTHNGDGQRDRVEYLQADAELARWEGRQEQARSRLEEARVLAETIGLAEERWQIQIALGDLEQLQGKPVLAEQAYARAGRVVQELAAKIEDEVWRMRFLTVPQVRRVLEQIAH